MLITVDIPPVMVVSIMRHWGGQNLRLSGVVFIAGTTENNLRVTRHVSRFLEITYVIFNP